MTGSINAYEAWMRAVPGEMDAKEAGIEDLRQAWMAFFGTDEVSWYCILPPGLRIEFQNDDSPTHLLAGSA